MKEQGTVMWFSSQKGFGFIRNDSGGADVFVHHTCIQMEGYRKLDQGDRVEYEIGQGPKGIQAMNVKVIQ